MNVCKHTSAHVSGDTLKSRIDQIFPIMFLTVDILSIFLWLADIPTPLKIINYLFNDILDSDGGCNILPQ